MEVFSVPLRPCCDNTDDESDVFLIGAKRQANQEVGEAGRAGFSGTLARMANGRSQRMWSPSSWHDTTSRLLPRAAGDDSTVCTFLNEDISNRTDFESASPDVVFFGYHIRGRVKPGFKVAGFQGFKVYVRSAAGNPTSRKTREVGHPGFEGFKVSELDRAEAAAECRNCGRSG
jgi:hypothetical protein